MIFINWENVLNKALRIGNRFMKAQEIQKDPLDYVLEELVIFVYSRNPSFQATTPTKSLQ